MHTNTDGIVLQKTRELCEAILKEPEFQSIRANMDKFMADQQAQQLYQDLSEKGHYLQHKQQQGVQLENSEVEAFEKQREKFFNNPVAKGFIDAQQKMHEVQDSVNEYVAKTFELGRLPQEDDFHKHGGCGDHSCGCKH